MRFLSKKPVEHFTDGRESSKKEAFGLTENFFITCCVTIVILALLFIFVPYISFSFYIHALFTIFAVLFLYGLYYLKKRLKRSLNMKHQLHMISHDIRDVHIQTNMKNKVDIENISKNFCTLIKEYFRILTKDDTIGVAIRIAVKQNEQIFYETVGRDGLNPNRKFSSESLRSYEGIANFLRENGNKNGITLINNISKSESVFKLDENSKKYYNEIATMMVCPINGWDGEQKEMIGILYITSKKTGIFGEKHTDSMGFIADAMATVYSNIIMKLLSIKDDETTIVLSEEDKYKYKGENNESIQIM